MQCSVLYYSVSDHTKKMAEAIVNGMIKEGMDAQAFSIDDFNLDYIKNSSGLILGTPVYGGGPAAKFYTFLEKLDQLKPAGKPACRRLLDYDEYGSPVWPVPVSD